jgi:hypothetical protein
VLGAGHKLAARAEPVTLAESTRRRPASLTPGVTSAPCRTRRPDPASGTRRDPGTGRQGCVTFSPVQIAVSERRVADPLPATVSPPASTPVTRRSFHDGGTVSRLTA